MHGQQARTAISHISGENYGGLDVDGNGCGAVWFRFLIQVEIEKKVKKQKDVIRGVG